MNYCKVGELNIPMIGLGLFSMHDKHLISSITSSFDYGYRLYDTAYRYANEKEIGLVLSSNETLKKSSLLCTKISGLQFNGHPCCFNLDKQTIRKSVTRAIERVKKTQIDIMLLHSPFRGYPIAFKELLDVQKEGLVRVVGVSGYNIEQLEAIKQVCCSYPQVCMLEIHPYHSSPDTVGFCNEKGIKVFARSPFAHGLIFDELKKEIIIQKLIKSTSKSVPQIILRWCIQHGWIAIPRSSNSEHIKENISIFDFELSESQMQMIDSLNRNKTYGVFANSYSTLPTLF